MILLQNTQLMSSISRIIGGLIENRTLYEWGKNPLQAQPTLRYQSVLKLAVLTGVEPATSAVTGRRTSICSSGPYKCVVCLLAGVEPAFLSFNTQRPRPISQSI